MTKGEMEREVASLRNHLAGSCKCPPMVGSVEHIGPIVARALLLIVELMKEKE